MTKSLRRLYINACLYLDAGTNLEIRQGLTSQSPLAEALTQPVSLPAAGPEYLLPSDIGFYLRLRGRLSASFKLAIAYTVYGYIGNTNFLIVEILTRMNFNNVFVFFWVERMLLGE